MDGILSWPQFMYQSITKYVSYLHGATWWIFVWGSDFRFLISLSMWMVHSQKYTLQIVSYSRFISLLKIWIASTKLYSVYNESKRYHKYEPNVNNTIVTSAYYVADQGLPYKAIVSHKVHYISLWMVRSTTDINPCSTCI